MSLLTRLLGKRERLAIKIPGQPISGDAGGWLGGTRSAAGARVDSESALSLSAVFAGVNLLSRIIGALPRQVFRLTGRTRLPAVDHSGYAILGSQPNPEMTAATFWRVMEWNRLLHGVACAEIQWAGSGMPAALWPLQGWRVKPDRGEDGSLVYVVDGRRKVAPNDMIVVPLVSADGCGWRSFLAYAIESLGLALTTQEFAARYFGNGAKPGAILKHPGSPPKEAREEFKRSWNERHGGASRSGGTAVMWGGWEHTGTDGAYDAEKNQLLEQRRFSTDEVARWLNMPPHMLRDLTRSTNNNIEQQGIDFICYSIGPTLVDYEQECDRKLLDPPNLYSKHNVAALMRGDAAARSAFYHIMLNDGVFSINDVLDLEDRNPIENGDERFVPQNMQRLKDAVADKPPAPEPTPALPAPKPAPEQQSNDPAATREAVRQLFASTLVRMAKVEANALRRAREKPGRLLTWLDDFYPRHRVNLQAALEPVGVVIGATLGAGAAWNCKAGEVATHWCEMSRDAILSAADRTQGECVALLEVFAAAWESTRAEETARILLGD